MTTQAFTPPRQLDAVKQKKRINWIDVTRGIAFLMVIYSHLQYCNSSLMHYFSPIFLTTFFFVSGYLFKEGCSFKQVFEQRTRTLLFPFLVFGGFMISLNQVVTFNETVPLVDRVKGLLLQNGHNQLLWFIAALYVYSLAFYWVERWAVSIKGLFIFVILLFFANTAYSFWLELPSLPWHITGTGFGCFYMAMGKIYKEYEIKIDKWVTLPKLMIAVVLYVLLLFLHSDKLSWSGSKWMIDALVITGLGIFVNVYLSKKIACINNNRFLLFVGANTLFYFAFHGKVYSLLQTVINKLIVMGGIEHTTLLDLSLGIGITLLDAIILIPFAMLVNKYLPWTLGKGYKLWK